MRDKKKYRKFALILLGIILIIFAGKILLDIAKISPFLFELLFKKEISLKENNNKINVLFLGIGGGAHDGPNLTDTIILATFDKKENKVTLASIPRDLWVPDLEHSNKKINTAYAYGEGKKEGGGLVLAKAVVGKILNQKIDYAIRINFEGFVKAVDLVEGVDVDVERAFEDPEYPIAGKENDPCGHEEEELEALATVSSQLEAFPCRYKLVKFGKGMQHMNGETALTFVRSRHASGNEGTDFARSNRQEKVLAAFKNKILSVQTILNPTRITSLYSILQDSIDTDIQQNEFDDFVRLIQKMKDAELKSIIIDTGDENKKRSGLLTTPDSLVDYNLQWVLIPRIGNGNFSEIQDYVSCEQEKNNCTITSDLN